MKKLLQTKLRIKHTYSWFSTFAFRISQFGKWKSGNKIIKKYETKTFLISPFCTVESRNHKYIHFYYELVTSDFRVSHCGKRKSGMYFLDDLKKMDPLFPHCGKRILLSEMLMILQMLHSATERLNIFTSRHSFAPLGANVSVNYL